jgi:hypothetical protein
MTEDWATAKATGAGRNGTASHRRRGVIPSGLKGLPMQPWAVPKPAALELEMPAPRFSF